MKVIGMRRVDFSAQDGNRITGYSLYCTFPIGKGGTGEGCDKIFLSDNKIAQSNYLPQVGDEINVSYNRFGKVDAVIPLHC